MVKIRLRRVGAKKQPSYRIVIADSRSPRDGRFIEMVGFYNPRTEPETVEYEEERVLFWLGEGAQPTDAVARLLEKRGTLERFARLKAGESLEVLLAEAEAGAEAQPVVEAEVQEAEPVLEEAEEEAPVEAEPEMPAEAPDQGGEEAET